MTLILHTPKSCVHNAAKLLLLQTSLKIPLLRLLHLSLLQWLNCSVMYPSVPVFALYGHQCLCICRINSTGRFSILNYLVLLHVYHYIFKCTIHPPGCSNVVQDGHAAGQASYSLPCGVCENLHAEDYPACPMISRYVMGGSQCLER
jgi:hypothetical protein